MNNYESGGVPPPQDCLRDKIRKCEQCGGVYIGGMTHACPEQIKAATANPAPRLRPGQGRAQVKTIY